VMPIKKKKKSSIFPRREALQATYIGDAVLLSYSGSILLG
jgi:hypothetical protein